MKSLCHFQIGICNFASVYKNSLINCNEIRKNANLPLIVMYDFVIVVVLVVKVVSLFSSLSMLWIFRLSPRRQIQFEQSSIMVLIFSDSTSLILTFFSRCFSLDGKSSNVTNLRLLLNFVQVRTCRKSALLIRTRKRRNVVNGAPFLDLPIGK